MFIPNIQKFTYKNCKIEVKPKINPKTKKWFAEYVITENYPEGTRFRGFCGKKEFPNQETAVKYYKKLSMLDVDNS